MREKKKSLRLKKYVVANLRTYTLKGGTVGSNPCVPTGPNPSQTCPTIDLTCPVGCDPDTRTVGMTQPENPCTCADNGDGPDGKEGLNSGPGCP